MRADEVLTVTMTETVHYKLTLTADRLAEITGIPLSQLATFIATHPDWTGLAGIHGEAVECLRDVVDCDSHYAGTEDRSWTVSQPLPETGPPAFHRDTHQLLTAVADALQLSLAYVDRDTVEAHLDRALSDAEWSAAHDQFTALDFDEHVSDQATFRAEWIETVLAKAGIPGNGYTADGRHRASASTDRGGAAA